MATAWAAAGWHLWSIRRFFPNTQDQARRFQKVPVLFRRFQKVPKGPKIHISKLFPLALEQTCTFQIEPERIHDQVF